MQKIEGNYSVVSVAHLSLSEIREVACWLLCLEINFWLPDFF